MALQNALAGLFPGFGQLFQHLVHAPEHLLGLGPRPVGLRPTLVQQFPITASVAAHGADQAIHLAQGLFALPLAIGFIPGMGHLHAEFIDATDKALGGIHSVLEPLFPNQPHRIHQREGGVPQQHPINRVVNVSLQRGGIDEGVLQVQRFGQLQCLRGGSPQVEELVNEGPHLRLGPPEIISLEGALAGHTHPTDFTEATEVLQHRTIGQADGKATIVFRQQDASDVAAQSASGMALVILLRLGTDLLAPPQPPL